MRIFVAATLLTFFFSFFFFKENIRKIFLLFDGIIILMYIEFVERGMNVHSQVVANL